mmetsp:Transcript_19851/g.50151  ORF Transcript_19851/g.50151 Transcript_19851/m.50151 type:complete len:158 (+) Transcript_19851:1-474(+)
MEEVVCPAPLRKALGAVWAKEPEFSVIRQVAEHDEDFVLHNTLYRFVVLWGLKHFAEAFEGSPVMDVLENVLGLDAKGRSAAKARAQFEADAAKFALLKGTDPYFSRAWARLHEMHDDAAEILMGLLLVDPATRIVDYSDIASHTMFAPLQVGPEAA